jgi:hypothetical protein
VAQLAGLLSFSFFNKVKNFIMDSRIHIWCFSLDHVNEQRRLEQCQHPKLIRVGRKNILILFLPKNNSQVPVPMEKICFF